VLETRGRASPPPVTPAYHAAAAHWRVWGRTGGRLGLCPLGRAAARGSVAAPPRQSPRSPRPPPDSAAGTQACGPDRRAHPGPAASATAQAAIRRASATASSR
jgi:hypothetical protein